jgi:hypothetical protein
VPISNLYPFGYANDEEEEQKMKKRDLEKLPAIIAAKRLGPIEKYLKIHEQTAEKIGNQKFERFFEIEQESVQTLSAKRETSIENSKKLATLRFKNYNYIEEAIIFENASLISQLIESYGADDDPPMLLEVPSHVRPGHYTTIEGLNFGDSNGNVYLVLPNNTIAFEIISWSDSSILIRLEESIGGIEPHTYGEMYVKRSDGEESNRHNIMFEPRYHFVVGVSDTWHVRAVMFGVSDDKFLYSPSLPDHYVPDDIPFTIHVTGDEDDPANVYCAGGPYYDSAHDRYYVLVHAGDERACNLYIRVIFRGLVPQGFQLPDEWDDWGAV